MRWLFILMAFVFLSACEEPVDLTDLPDDSGEPVVMCNFTKGKPFIVFVTKTKSSLAKDQTTEYLDDVSVRISQNGYKTDFLSFVNNANTKVPSYYYSDNLSPLVGVPYFLEVKMPNGELLTARSSIPRPSEVSIKSFSAVKKKIGNFKTRVDFSVKVEVKDPLYASNYYYLNFYQKFIQHQFGGDAIIIDGPLDSDFDASNIPLLEHFDGKGILFDDTTFDGQNVTLVASGSFVHSSNQDLDDFFVELTSGSADYYNYLTSLSRQLSSGASSFAEAVVVDHNIKNGYGVFAGYSTSLDSTFLGN